MSELPLEARMLLTKMKADFKGWCRNVVRIRYEDGAVGPLILNPAQEILVDQIIALEAQSLPVRIVILKARQMGMSTVICAYLAWKAWTHNGSNCLTVAHKEDAAAELFGKIELMYRHLPEWFKDSLDKARDTKRTGKKLSFQDPLETLLFVDTGQEVDVGRSMSFNYAHLSELPFWKDARKSCTALFQSIRMSAGTAIIIESTANGMGDFFHETWLKAEEGVGTFIPIFIPWFVMPKYAEKWVAGIDRPLTSEERRLRKAYNLSKEQLKFRRLKIGEIGEDGFKQEYPSNAREAFLFAGQNFFNAKALENLNEKLYLPGRDAEGKPLLRYQPTKGYFYRAEKSKTARFIEDPGGQLHIWEKPVRNGVYAIGADVSSGRALDYSVAQVLRVFPDHRQQVASLFTKIEPSAFGTLIYYLAIAFNGAILGIERNAGYGDEALNRVLHKHGYRNHYRSRDLNRIKRRESDELGWRTTSASRLPMLERLNSSIREGTIDIFDPRTLRELENFVITDDRAQHPEANPGATDDGVMALGIAETISAQAHAPRENRQAPSRPPGGVQRSRTTGY